MTCQFIFKVGLPQWRSYTFFNECSLCTLYSSKEIPIAAILLNAAIYILRHCWFSNRQKEAAALKIKATASKARESVSALRQLFFLLPSFGRYYQSNYLPTLFSNCFFLLTNSQCTGFFLFICKNNHRNQESQNYCDESRENVISITIFRTTSRVY